MSLMQPLLAWQRAMVNRGLSTKDANVHERTALATAPAGCLLRLTQVDAGRRLKRRLAELGLTPGTEMTVIQNAGGPILVAVRQSRLALGRGMAEKMTVELLEERTDL